MNVNLIVFFYALENIAIIAGATIAAISFKRPGILAWYILILLNGYRVNLRKDNEEEKYNE